MTTQHSARAERRFTIHYGFALLATFSALGTLIPFVTLMIGAANSDDPGSFAGTFAVLWLLWGGMWTLVWVAFAIQHTLAGRRR